MGPLSIHVNTWDGVARLSGLGLVGVCMSMMLIAGLACSMPEGNEGRGSSEMFTKTKTETVMKAETTDLQIS